MNDDAERLWNAGGAWWEAFILHRGRISKDEAIELAAKFGYHQQVVASYIRHDWLEAVGSDLIFTERSWRHLAADWRAYREANRGAPYVADRGAPATRT